MTTSKRFNDYPLSFWAGVIASLTTASLAIASYSGMIADSTAFLKAIALVISFELGLIIAMATFAGKLQGLLKGWALVVLLLISLAEIFMTSMEIQGGVARQGANASNYQQSSSNLGAVANGLASATKALSDCDKRYPRKVKDSKVREECRKPYESIVKNSAGAMNTDNNTPKYNEGEAGQLIQWQSVADALNAAWNPATPITWSQAAFYILTLIMALLILIKNFFWAKYAHDVELAANDNLVIIDEQKLGEPDAMPQPQASEAETRKPFGFSPSNPAPSSAAINRAKYMHVSTLEPIHAHVNTRPCNNTHDPLHARVNTRPRNNTHDDLHAAYTHAADANAGEHVNCPQCGTVFRKVNKQHTFCQKTCKDEWWNTKDPTRLEALKALKRRGKAA